MKSLLSKLMWLGVAALGAFAYAVMALHRREPINSAYILLAALCSYAIGFRFYSKWIATRVLVLNDRRATPCEVHDDGKDFVKTNKWIVFGHHFAAISGPGPLVRRRRHSCRTLPAAGCLGEHLETTRRRKGHQGECARQRSDRGG